MTPSLTRRRWLQASMGAAAAWALPAPPLLAQIKRRGAIALTLNENPFGPSPLAAQAIRAHLDDLHRYVGDEAAPLTQRIAAYEQVAPEQIVLGEILEPLGLQLGLKDGPGGEFVYSVPGYPALVNAAARIGGKVVSVPLNARLENDLPALAAAVTSRTRAVFLVNPHNPSGTVNAPADFAGFLRETARRTLVIVDEAYLEFSDDYAGRTAVTLTRAGENVLVFRTFAKVWGLAALPLGYAVAPRALADDLRARGLGSPRDLNRLALVAAEASLRDTGYITRIHRTVADERRKWHAFLDQKRRPRTDSQANFVYFDAGRPHAQITQALTAEGIAVGRAFPPYDSWVRITIGRTEDNARVRTVLDRIL